jgi:hypothetical protein
MPRKEQKTYFFVTKDKSFEEKRNRQPKTTLNIFALVDQNLLRKG